jgi:Nuclease-related domain
MSLESRRAMWARHDGWEQDTRGDPPPPDQAGAAEHAGASRHAEVSRRAGTPQTQGGTDASHTPDPESGTSLPVPRRKIRHLARDSRMPVWRRRLLIALAVGIAVTILTNWRIGLTLAVVAAIVDAVIRSRSSAASSAEGLTTSAQRRTKRELAKLERSGYRSLHIRAIPDSDEVIDHLLIGPTGVYAIDSEQWDKRLPVRTRNARQLWHGPFSQKDRLEHARWEAMQASELLSNALGEPITVRAAMAVYGPAIPWGVATIRDVDVFSGDRLRKYLRKHSAGARGPRLTGSEVERIYAAADRVLRPKR